MKTWNLFFVLVLIAGGLFAQNVAEEEVRIPGTIRFESNEGVPDKVETVEQIRGIGVSLGQNPESPERQYYGRYRVQHVVDPSETGLFDADILSLERSSTVDHIRNLRLIIAGFLSTAYGYSPNDARLLAEFVTVYNAVYRKNMDYFGSKYKKAVASKLDAARAGISTNWREWPGGTQMLLPLDDGTQGSLSAVDTGAITDKNVVEELRKQEDKGIDSRKDMVDLKEEQIAQQQEKVAEEKQQVAEEKQQVAQKEEQVAQKEQQVAQKQQQVEQEKKAAVTEPQKQEAAKKEEAVKKEQAQVAEEKKAVEEEKKAVEEKEDAIAQEEEKIEEKQEEVRDDRKEIAQDQEEVLARDAAAALRGIPFVKVQSGAKGSLVLVDPKTGDVLADVSGQPVTIRSYDSFAGGLAAILQRAGSDSGRLSVLDRGTLKEKTAAREEVYGESSFQVNGAELFVVIRDEGKWYLGKYDATLALLARSRTEVNPATFILFSDAHVFVEDPSGKVVPLSLGDMQ